MPPDGIRRAPSVTTWIGLLSVGDADAARPLWHRDFASPVTLARRHLSDHIRTAAAEVDPDSKAAVDFGKAEAGWFKASVCLGRPGRL